MNALQKLLFNYLVLPFCILTMAACAGSKTIFEDSLLQVGKMYRQTLQHDGIEREYFVYLPHSYKKSKRLPVVFLLHGYTTSASGAALESTTGFNHYAERNDFIAVYPQGSHFTTLDNDHKPQFVSSWNDLAGNKAESPLGPMCTENSVQYPCPPECGECGRCHWVSCNDDVGFIDKMLGEIKRNLNTDDDRYYLIGISNGAMMAHRLACKLDQQFAAVALTIGRLQRGYNCTPERAMSIIQINGARDRAVPLDGSVSSDGFYYTSSDTVSKDWARQAQCSSKAKIWNNEITKAQGLKCHSYENCADEQTEVVECLWPEGEHVWPGNIGGGGWCVAEVQKDSIPEFPLCKVPEEGLDIWGSALIWRFFQEHPRLQ